MSETSFTGTGPSDRFRNRIRGLEYIDASQIDGDPRNWRKHTPEQRAALQNLLEHVGIANAVLVYRTPEGRYRLVDGQEWVYRKFGDVFMLDDDSVGMYRVYRRLGGRKRGRVSPDRAYEIVQRTAETARELGAFLFGFRNHCHPATYVPQRPFRFGGYLTGGALGLLKGSKLYWPPVMLPIDDYWISLLNAYYHRYAFIDTRFAFGFRDTYVAPGGLNDPKLATNRQQSELEGFRFLRRHFGEAVRRVPTGPRGPLTKKIRNVAKRQIKLPYDY